MCHFPPILDLDPSFLAGLSVSLQCPAEEMSKATSHAHIIFTVLQVWLWVNDAMTFPEWPISCECDEPTKPNTLPFFHQIVFTAFTSTHTVISALGIFHQAWHLPAAPKGHCSTCLGAGGCGEIILGVAIEVATETTSLTSVIVRQFDHKFVFPVILDSQTKISLNDHRATALEHNKFVVLQGYWQTPQIIVNLDKRK